ncbi:MAG: hypothetical protein QM704_17075 [Anaeromyxobacteraceae bacterium]
MIALSALPVVAALCAALPAAPTAEAAVAAALAVPGARAEVRGVSGATPRGCVPAAWSAARAVGASGQVPLGFDGRDAVGARCTGVAWADVRVSAAGLRATRDLRAGEPLAGATVAAEVVLEAGRRPLPALPAGATAARPLRAGDVLDEADLRVGPGPGDPVTVAVRAGGVELTVTGKALACARGKACALLPGGRRVEGRWDGARIALEAP